MCQIKLAIRCAERCHSKLPVQWHCSIGSLDPVIRTAASAAPAHCGWMDISAHPAVMARVVGAMGDLEGRVALEGREKGLAMQTFYLRKLSRRLSCMAVLWSLLVVVKGVAAVPAVVAGKVCVACYCISQCAAFLARFRRLLRWCLVCAAAACSQLFSCRCSDIVVGCQGGKALRAATPHGTEMVSHSSTTLQDLADASLSVFQVTQLHAHNDGLCSPCTCPLLPCLSGSTSTA